MRLVLSPSRPLQASRAAGRRTLLLEVSLEELAPRAATGEFRLVIVYPHTSHFRREEILQKILMCGRLSLDARSSRGRHGGSGVPPRARSGPTALPAGPRCVAGAGDARSARMDTLALASAVGRRPGSLCSREGGGKGAGPSAGLAIPVTRRVRFQSRPLGSCPSVLLSRLLSQLLLRQRFC